MRLAHFGTFDVENYGDLLFPLIVEHKLSDIFDEIIHVSPLGAKPYSDVAKSVKASTLNNTHLDGLLVGGGNILHASWTNLPAYRKVKYTAYPRLWSNAAALAQRSGSPLVVNAPGAPNDFHWPSKKLVRELAAVATYFAVRDKYSQHRLGQAGVHGLSIVPDTAIQISDVLPYDSASISKLPAPLSLLKERDYIAVHVNARYSEAGVVELAAMLDRINAESGLKICLLGIGPCHGDDVLAKRLASHMNSTPLVLANPETVTAVAHTIAGSRYYLGSSLHGFITASSFGVPALLVADHAKQSKFRGLLEQMHATDRMVGSWSEILEHVRADEKGLLIEPAETAACRKALDAHWSQVRAALQGAPSRRSKSSIKARMLVLKARNVGEGQLRSFAKSVLAKLGLR
jgi:polysaccharide pyruvyl transferase WcaK-like protein